MNLRIAGATCAAAATFASASAWGSGFALLEQNGSGLGRAFAGTAAVADDATTVYFNPAGLSRLPGVQLAAAASGVNIDTRFHDAASVAALGQPLGAGGGNAGGLSIVPAVYLSASLTDSLTVGLGINAPFGLKTEYDAGWMGRFQALRSEVKTINVNPTLSWAPTEHMSFGVGVSYQRIDAVLTNAVNYTAVVAQGAQQLVLAGQLTPQQAQAIIAGSAGLEGAARVEGDDTTWGFNVGALFDLGDSTRLGLAYRSRIKYDVSGKATFVAPTASIPTAQLIIQAASAGALADGPVSLDLKLPDQATVSLVQRLGERASLSVDVAWTGWSSVPELKVVRAGGAVLSTTPEDWDDTWRVALGGDCKVAPNWTLRAGIAYDRGPVPDETRTPRLPDKHRTWLAVGAGWDATSAAHVDLGYAHLWVKDAPLDQDAGNAAAYGLLVGAQKTKIDIFAAQLSYKF